MWVISMKKESKWIVAVVCAVVAAALVVALVLLLPGQGEDQPQASMPTGDMTEPSDPGNVTEPSDTAAENTHCINNALMRIHTTGSLIHSFFGF